MNAELGFGLTNLLGFSGFLLLCVGRFVTGPFRQRLALTAGRVIPIVLAAGYVGLLATQSGNQPDGAGLTSLDGLRASFGDDGLLLLGWVHYLAFDLLVEFWEFQDADRRGVPNWAVIISMALTFVMGPAGFLVYLALRATTTRTSPLALDPA